MTGSRYYKGAETTLQRRNNMPKRNKLDKDALDKIEAVIKNHQDNACPEKEDDNCKKPGSYSDSKPIGGGG
jgi:hypothetical protein